jgi:hypothetical protein
MFSIGGYNKIRILVLIRQITVVLSSNNWPPGGRVILVAIRQDATGHRTDQYDRDPVTWSIMIPAVRPVRPS